MYQPGGERMNDQTLWNLVREVWAELGAHFEPVIEKRINESGLDGRRAGLLLAAATFEPENTTPGHLLVRGPYTAAEEYLARLRSLAEAGYLEEVSPGSFRLTPQGDQWKDEFLAIARQAMVEADPLAKEDSLRLAEIIDKLIKACLETPPPPDTWSIRLSSKLLPDKEPPMPFIEQAITCLSAYRDDSHLAAWQESGLSATALEVLTLVWRDQVSSLDTLTDSLAHRGHPRTVYADAVNELHARDFIKGTHHEIRLSEDGHSFREQVEMDTDRYFFAPWERLDESEREEFRQLLTQMKEGLESKKLA
jgi:hypothetical protein